MPFQYKPTVSRSRAGRALAWALAAVWAPTAHADVQASDQASASVKASTPSALVASPIEALAPMDVHPEEHLLPLHVCLGIANKPADLVFDDQILGKRSVAFLW